MKTDPSMPGGEDLLGALPDDMLHLLLPRLDTRSALATAALSTRWARLPRELPVLEFNVTDVLPESYRRHLRRRLDAANLPGNPWPINKLASLDLVLAHYERRGMPLLADSLRGFLDADDAAEARRRVHRVSLVISPTNDSGILKALNRLIATAIGGWGVEELEVVVLNRYRPEVHERRGSGYSFPHRCLDLEFPDSVVNLKRLKLVNCDPRAVRPDANLPPAHAFSALTTLVLQDMPMSTRSRVYEDVISACPALEVLHLRSCGCRGPSLVVDAPGSRITELVVELSGTVVTIDLRSLPRLERMACVAAPLELKFGSVPRLAHVNLAYPLFDCPAMLDLSNVLSGLPDVEDLVLKFNGPRSPRIFIKPGRITPLLGKLRRLLVEDVPPAWDIACTSCLLEAAPCLETLHVADDHGAVARLFNREPPSSEFKHRRLREVVVSGFEGTPRQVQLVRFLRRTCTALRDIMLLRNGNNVRHTGRLWDWETLAPPDERQWSDEKRGEVLSEIEDGTDAIIACSNTRIVFG
jgi:hypothetical protein